ncbi:MAG: hypothetical protein ACOH2T_19295 [Pseudomonas sp.]
MSNEDQNYLDLPDDQFSDMSPPEPVVEVETPEIPDDVAPEVEAVEVETPILAEQAEEVVPQLEQEADPVSEEVPVPAGSEVNVGDDKGPEETEAVIEEKKDEAPKEEAPDYQAFYDRLLKNPIRANGKDIQLKSPEEVERAIQMGLNYTKKMQTLQPALRVVKMLENNKLLDETQLSYLIDLHQKKPEAIQKLLAESQFDANEVDTDKAEQYVPGNHQVSDNEMAFESALEYVENTPTGPELITEIARQWDANSRQALFDEPGLLSVINDQKANGIYGRITSEVARRQALGNLQGMPFLRAYKTVGDELQAQGLLVQTQQAPPPVPVATRVVAPSPKVANNDRAKAASAPKAIPTAIKMDVNHLAQSDEDFLKEMEGRV